MQHVCVKEISSCLESCLFVFQNLVVSQTVIAGIILFCGWLYFSMFLPKGETQLSQLGFICSVVTVSMYLSPLSSLVRENTSGQKADLRYIRTQRVCVVRPSVFARNAHTVTCTHRNQLQ